MLCGLKNWKLAKENGINYYFNYELLSMLNSFSIIIWQVHKNIGLIQSGLVYSSLVRFGLVWYVSISLAV